MKRLLQLILFILLVIGLVACSDKEETNDVTKGGEVTEGNKMLSKIRKTLTIMNQEIANGEKTNSI